MLESMRHQYTSILLNVIFFASIIASDSCSPNPIAIRIGNITLANHQVARGAEIDIGDPPQSFAFLPQWPHNTSLVYGIDGHCIFKRDAPTNDGCTTLRGGAYDAFASKTRQMAYSAEFPREDAPFPQTTLVTDRMKLNENLTLEEFPFGVALNDWGAEGYHPMALLGLGTNSSFLNTLQESGKIASRTWSFFWGRSTGPPTSQTDGSLVIGGYDRAKISSAGRHVERLQDSTSPCSTQMIVTITDMVLNFPNGTDSSIFPKSLSTALTACIVPDYPVLMTLPSDPFMDNFFQLTDAAQNHERSFGINYYSFQYSANEKRYDGDLTIKFQSGLSVRVANDQLVVPDININPMTGELLANYTNPDLVINGLQNISSNDMPQIGRQFLSAAYLMVNQDSKQFSLWAANPTPGQELVAVDTDGNDMTTICESGVSTIGESSSPTPVPSPESTSHTSAGKIAGAVIGSVSGLAILGALILWWIKKRKHDQFHSSGQDHVVQSYTEDEPFQQFYMEPKAELADSSFIVPAELEHPTQRNLPPYELGN
ncbi:acid protease [Annulohypoxylon stygium]|nr:acid protease [Annulohypoxylon stygium]